MTTDIERQFFDTFGIEPEYKTCIFKYCKNKKEYDCENCNDREWHYPEITDRILLELVLINMHKEDLFGYPTSIEKLKENTLKQLIETYNKFSTCITFDSASYQKSAREIKQQVQALFKEG